MKQERVYLHLHIPNLPALLSQQQFPAAQGRPLVVVTDTSERGVVRSASPEAEALGVRTGLRVGDLCRWNGSLDLIPERPSQRLGTAQAVTAMLRSYTPSVRVLGENRFVLDLTGTERLWGSPSRVAEQILRRLRHQWKLAAAIGVGPSRTVARVAASAAGAPGVFVVDPEHVSEFLSGQPLERLPGIGSKTRERLRRYSLRTVGELARVPQELLLETFGSYRGMLLWRLAQGRDTEPLKVKKEISSLSRETALPEDTLDLSRLEAFVAYLCGRVALDLRRRKRAAHRMAVRVVYSDGLQRQMNQTLPNATNLEMELALYAQPLLGELLASRRVRIQKVGVTVSRLRPSSGQAALFDLRGFQRQESVADDVARVRRRYGFNAVTSGRARTAVG